MATHKRSYGRGDVIEDPKHIQDLVHQKKKARRHSGMDRLYHAAPCTEAFFHLAAQRGGNLGGMTQKLLTWFDGYGAETLGEAVSQAVAADRPHLSAVYQELERIREEKGPPPSATTLAEPSPPTPKHACKIPSIEHV